MEPLERMHRLADKQGRRISRAQARGEGVPDSTFTDHARRMAWKPELRGIWTPEDARPDYLGQTRGVVLAVGVPLRVTAATALWLFGVLHRPPDSVHVLLPTTRWLRQRDGVCLYYTAGFDALRWRTMRDLPTVLLPRALADHSKHSSLNEMVCAMADANRLRLTTLPHLKSELEARGRWPGRAAFRTALQLLTRELTHSSYERLGRRLLRGAGHRFHPRPFAVEHNQRIIAEIDVAFPDLRYGVEIDGPPHLLPEVAARDRARDRQLARLSWTIDRFLWMDLENHPERFVREVTERLRLLHLRR